MIFAKNKWILVTIYFFTQWTYALVEPGDIGAYPGNTSVVTDSTKSNYGGTWYLPIRYTKKIGQFVIGHDKKLSIVYSTDSTLTKLYHNSSTGHYTASVLMICKA